MKRLGIIGLSVMLVSLYFLTNTTPSSAQTGSIESSVEKIQRFHTVLADKRIKPDSWSVFIREKSHEVKNKQVLDAQVRQLKKDLSTFKWNKASAQSGIYKVTAEKTDEKYGMKVHLSLFAYPHKDRFESYLVYEITGNNWYKGTSSALKRHVATHLSQIQHQQMTYYTCVKAHQGATMNNGLLKSVSGILHALHARPVEKVSEKTFISISAYTDYWKDTLTTGHKLMNVQVAMRQTGNSVTLILGSPIITTAY